MFGTDSISKVIPRTLKLLRQEFALFQWIIAPRPLGSLGRKTIPNGSGRSACARLGSWVGCVHAHASPATPLLTLHILNLHYPPPRTAPRTLRKYPSPTYSPLVLEIAGEVTDRTAYNSFSERGVTQRALCTNTPASGTRSMVWCIAALFGMNAVPPPLSVD